jgi:hypothetical protein
MNKNRDFLQGTMVYHERWEILGEKTCPGIHCCFQNKTELCGKKTGTKMAQ